MRWPFPRPNVFGQSPGATTKDLKSYLWKSSLEEGGSPVFARKGWRLAWKLYLSW